MKIRAVLPEGTSPTAVDEIAGIIRAKGYPVERVGGGSSCVILEVEFYMDAYTSLGEVTKLVHALKGIGAHTEVIL